MSTPIMIFSRPAFRLRFLCLCSVLCPVVLAAQTREEPRVADDTPTVQLDPFQVRSGSTNGYLAPESTTGSRYAAPVKEIPFPVQVITSDFIENFLAFDFSDAVAYTSSFSPTEGTGAFTLRGIRNLSAYKNGIREGGIYGPVSVDRIEVIKGANAAIYGQTEPSGLRNIVTKKAGPTPDYSLRVTGGSDDFFRVAVDVNQPLIRTGDKLLTRFDASYENSKQFSQKFAQFRRTVGYNSTTWKPFATTTITVDSEYIKFRSQAQNSGDLPFVRGPGTINGTTADYLIALAGTGPYAGFYSLNTAGPKGYNDVEYTQIDGTLSQRINDVWSIRLLGNFWKRDQNIVRTTLFSGSNANTYRTESGQLAGYSTPRLERNREWQDNAQADLLGQFKTGDVEHKFLLTYDYLLYDGDARQRTSSRIDASFPLNNLLTPGAPSSALTFPYEFDFGNTGVWNNDTTDVRRQTVTKGLMLSERASFFSGGLIMLVGGRSDATRNSQLDYRNSTVANGVLTPAGQMVDFPEDKATTPQTGMLLKLTSALSFYANYSESFNPQRTDIATNIDANGAPLPSQRGRGVEAGFKGAMFNETLFFTAGYYDIAKSNVPRVALDALGNTILIPGVPGGPATRSYSNLNDVRSRGGELDFNWRASANFSAFGGAGWNDTRYTTVDNPTEAYLIGTTPDNTPRWSGGVAGDYGFSSGWLKGVDLRLGVRYQGKMLINSTTYSPYGNSGVRGPDLVVNGANVPQYFFSNDAYWGVDAGVAYGWRTRNGWHHRVSLDGKNLTDAKYIQARKPGAPLTLNVTYQLRL
ncbi:MAG: TonB-dependent siderophore receptor [Opitutales bacterium]